MSYIPETPNGNMVKRTLLTLVFLLTFLSIAPKAQSQWEKIYDFGDTSTRMWDFEFLHQFGTPHIGLATIHRICEGTLGCLRTTDAGLTWEKIKVPDAVKFGTPGNFTFVDANTGFLMWSVTSTNHGILKTTDAGATWTYIATPFQGGWISANQWTGDIFVSRSINNILRSTDDGQSWAIVSNNRGINPITFTNANDGIVPSVLGSYQVTSDGGASWVLKNLPDAAYAFGIPNSRVFFIAAVRQVAPGDWEDIALNISTDAGSTWQARAVPRSWLQNSLYSWTGSQIISSGSNGIHTSADSGKSWKSLCGPHTWYWQYGYQDTIYAHDMESRLWVNRTLTSSRTLPNRADWSGMTNSDCKPYRYEACDPKSYLTITDQNACDPTVITSIEMTGSENFTNLQVPSLPLSVDTLYKLLFDYVGFGDRRDTANFRIKYTINWIDFDTTIMYVAQNMKPLVVKVSTSNIVARLKNVCEDLDTVVTTKIFIPCDSLELLNAWLEDSSLFRIRFSDFPTVKYAGQDTAIARVRIVANPLIGGTFITKLHLVFKYHTRVIDTTIELRLIVPSTGSPTISSYTDSYLRVCSVRDTSIAIVNGSCDTMTLAQASLNGNSIIDQIQLPLPLKILPGSTLFLPIRHTLDTVGSFSEVLTVKIHWMGRTLDTAPKLYVDILDSPPFSLQELVTFNEICDQQDTSVLIQNNRCDSIRIESAIVESGPAKVLARFPIDVAPSAIARFVILFTMKQPGVEFIRIKVRYSINGIARDTLVNIRVSVLKSAAISASAADRLPFSTVSTCSSKDRPLTIFNKGCEPVSLVVLDIQPQTDFAFVSPMSFPILLPADSSIDVMIRFAPGATGMKQATLTATLQNARGSVALKTNLTGTGNASGGGELVLDRDMIDFGTMTVCELDSMKLTLGNGGCDSLIIDPLTIDGSSPFSIDGIMSPKKLATSDELEVRVFFTPTALGKHSSKLRIRSRSETSTTWKEDIVTITGEVILPGDPLVISPAVFDPVSLCLSDSVRVPVSNQSCDIQLITPSTSGDFTVEPPSLTLAAGETGYYTVYFNPAQLGVRTGSLRIRSHDLRFDVQTLDTSLVLSAEALAGEKLLVSSLTSINFDETNICEERDSVVRLTNNGCDTLTIIGAEVDKHFNVGGSYPVVLAPGESIDVPITTIVDTTGKPTVLSGNLTITSTADNTIAPIVLVRGLSYPTKLRIEAIDDANGHAGQIVKFRVLLEGEVPSTMSALHFDFLHNGDLLSWDQYDGVGLNRTNLIGEESQRSSFTLSPVHDGQIAEFSFKTNLAIAEQTTLSFDNIRFNAAGVSFAPECIAVISDSGSRFNYTYSCGDGFMRDVLKGNRLLIKSITPNPAKDEIRLELNVDGQVEVSVFNALGAEMLQSAGSRIDVSALPSGVYFVRVSSGGATQSKRVVISK